MMCECHIVDKYFNSRMQRVFVYRVEYKQLETFSQYLSHRYRNSCYFYSSYALMGLNDGDRLVRGTITLDYDWMWEDGGYGHGWIEFDYQGEEYIFDSRCRYIELKKEWYEKFNPQNIVRFTKREILDSVFLPSKTRQLEDGAYEVYGLEGRYDKNYRLSPLKMSKIYMQNGEITKFIAYRKLL